MTLRRGPAREDAVRQAASMIAEVDCGRIDSAGKWHKVKSGMPVAGDALVRLKGA